MRRRRVAAGAGMGVLGLFLLLRLVAGDARPPPVPPDPSPQRVHRVPAPPAAPSSAAGRGIFSASRPEPAPDPPPPPGDAADAPAGSLEILLRVVDGRTGEPVTGAAVLPRRVFLPPGFPPPGPASGPDGILRVTGLPLSGEPRWIGAPGYASVRESLVPAGSPEEGAGEGPRELRLRRAGTLRGVLLDREGRPVAGARIRVARGIFDENLGRATTDADGRYVVEGLPEGPVLLLPGREPEDFLVVEVPSDGVADLPLGGPPRIQGRQVLPKGKRGDFMGLFPLGHGIDFERAYATIVRGGFPGTRVVDLDRDGAFSFAEVDPGRHFLVNAFGSAIAEVPEGGAGPVRVEMKPWWVSGRILRRGVAGDLALRVAAIREDAPGGAEGGDPEPFLHFLFALWGAAESEGRCEGDVFQAPVPGPGRYRVLLQGEGAGGADEIVLEAEESPRTDGPEVAVVPCAPVKVRLSPGDGHETLLLVARDREGRVGGVAVGDREARLFLPEGPWSLEVRPWAREFHLPVPPAGAEETVFTLD